MKKLGEMNPQISDADLNNSTRNEGGNCVQMLTCIRDLLKIPIHPLGPYLN